jgi:hypothetical protein
MLTDYLGICEHCLYGVHRFTYGRCVLFIYFTEPRRYICARLQSAIFIYVMCLLFSSILPAVFKHCFVGNVPCISILLVCQERRLRAYARIIAYQLYS